MNRRFIDYGIAALAAGLAAYVKDHYFSRAGQEALAYAISVSAGVALFVGLNWLWHLLEKWLRLDPRYGYLGTWVEDISKSSMKHYSLFEVKHNLIGHSFSVTGNTYDARTHAPFAEWVSTAVAFPEDNKLYYLHKSVIHGRAGDVSGLTRLNFVGSGGRFYEGTGYLIDNCDPIERVHFSFERLERSEIKRLIGKRNIRSKADRCDLFRKWIEDRQRAEVTPA